MTQKEEFEMMKSNPLKLYQYYLDLLVNEIQLDDAQKIKLEYLKKYMEEHGF